MARVLRRGLKEFTDSVSLKAEKKSRPSTLGLFLLKDSPAGKDGLLTEGFRSSGGGGM